MCAQSYFARLPPLLTIPYRCHRAVPGEPLDVQATPLNSTSIYVSWKPPQEKDQHGIIRGYHIHLQELKEEVSAVQLAARHGLVTPQHNLLGPMTRVILPRFRSVFSPMLVPSNVCSPEASQFSPPDVSQNMNNKLTIYTSNLTLPLLLFPGQGIPQRATQVRCRRQSRVQCDGPATGHEIFGSGGRADT